GTISVLPLPVNWRGSEFAISRNQRSTESCASPKMKYGLRAPVGTAEGIWIATASENSDGGAAGASAASWANGSAGSCPPGAATSCPKGLLGSSGVCPAGLDESSSSSGGTASVSPFFPV